MHPAVKDIKQLWNGNQMSNNTFILNGNMRTLSKHNTGTYFLKHNYTNNNLLFSSEEATVRSASCFFSPVIIGTHCSRFLKSWWVVRLHLSWVGILISPGTDFAAFHAASPSVVCYSLLCLSSLCPCSTQLFPPLPAPTSCAFISSASCASYCFSPCFFTSSLFSLC